MTLAYYCVFVAALLPYLWVAYAKWTSDYVKGGNRSPRAYGESLKGGRKRAYWAQQNSFEAFPIFAAVVIIAHLVGRSGQWMDVLSLVFVFCRVAHGLFYIADLPTLRTLAWTGGALAEVAMVLWIVAG